MVRKPSSLRRQLAATAVFALAASGVALADDSSMSMWTGDSYAFFNNLDYSAGKFNMARAPRMQEQDAVAKSPRKEERQAGERTLLADRPSRGTPTHPFSDKTGS